MYVRIVLSPYLNKPDAIGQWKRYLAVNQFKSDIVRCVNLFKKPHIGLLPSGKAQGFDPCIRKFESY